MNKSIPAVVLGASGYVGGELVRLIAGHPDFDLAAAVSSSAAGQPIADTFGHLSSRLQGACFKGPGDWPGTLDDGTDLALFSAAPHGASAAMIANALTVASDKNLTVHIVDSSADFRYTRQADFESVYETPHGAPQLLEQFRCALPEHTNTVPSAHIGHPGCFATAILLALVPLLQSGLTDAEVFVCGVTGSTGSGRKPQAGTHHPERNSNFYAYKPLVHRHVPEVTALAEAASGRVAKVNFVPHSGPFARGIQITLQATTKQAINEQQLQEVYEQAYADKPFVEIISGTPRLKNVVASNYCRIGVATNGNSVVVMSAIDNLVKGAAGGAMQWMNRLWNLPETAGLTAAAPGWT